ncbi:hypothetical protein LX32DRAFT_74198 [Colletotrichum zoysiae]|uniref:Uncharacterized protein n=1 Tax=Colletotrichum zoysiae TaxID=1216348 RepID=A0AAD9HR87_9PEZI|nr:hypothetical protein LX32DRAFT_74198 [Colletotrichum zoysiae]
MVYFQDLPREIRDMIYVRYVSVNGGYVLDFDSNTLKGADGESIDLAFMLTCKSVAREMRGVALSSNTITFSTFHSKEHETTAGRYDLMVDTLMYLRNTLLDRICPATLRIPDDIYEELSKSYPALVPYLDLLRTRAPLYPGEDDGDDEDTYDERPLLGPPGSCGETPSVFRSFVHSVLQAIATHRHRFDINQFAKFEKATHSTNYVSVESLVNLKPELWSIPTREGVEEMISSMGNDPVRYINNEWSDPFLGSISMTKHRYSAAAVAIRFLESLSKDSRSNIKNIVLDEDRAAVAFAECHAMGLVPYCQENPRLRVERRVNMWRTVFQTKTVNDLSESMNPQEGTTFHLDDMSCCMGVWILEALELEPAGMPPGSFTLTFDGDRVCSIMFENVVQRDAAWQEAIDLCFERNIFPPVPWLKRRRDSRNFMDMDEEDGVYCYNKWYVFEGFPQAIRDIANGNSIVKCNFAVEKPWDVEKGLEQNKGWTFGQWKSHWLDSEKILRVGEAAYQPDPPSPSWLQMLCENSWDTRLPQTVLYGPYDPSLRGYYTREYISFT